MAQSEPLLRRPLYVFDLPSSLLSSLQPKSDDTTSNAPHPEPELQAKGTKTVPEDKAAIGSASCALCGVTFKDAQEQRRHAKSDFHGYNVKQRMKGLKTVNEAAFEDLLNDLAESISGSDTSESDEDGEDTDKTVEAKGNTLVALLKKQAKISSAVDVQDDEAPKGARRRTGGSPMLWFTAQALPPNVSLGIYKALFANAELEDKSKIPEAIQKRQLSCQPGQQVRTHDPNDESVPSAGESPHFFLCMMGGGHFAAMVVSLTPKINKKAGGVEERQATVVAHKTFHRYTTRRKQGGAQSSSDASKGAAHSAGSSLRRHNEAALTNEVRELLGQWKPMIDSAQLVFVRATGNTNRRTLYGPYEGQVLRANDPRIRGFPFNTRRATQAELLRAFVELTRVKVSEVDEAALAAAAAARASESASTTRPAKSSTGPAPPKISEEEQAAALHTSQLQSLIRRSKAPAVISYLSKNSLPADFRFHPMDSQQHYHAPTPLHLAASTNSASLVLAMLTKANADPTIVNGEDKTAFDLAGERSTRDAFRVARHVLGEERWDWTGAHVPGALTKEEADARDERERKEREKKEEERRKTEKERLKEEEEKLKASQEGSSRPQQNRAGKTLGGGGGLAGGRALEKTPQERRDEETRGLTPEARMRLERERRARAAEERIRRMQNRGGGGGGSGGA